MLKFLKSLFAALVVKMSNSSLQPESQYIVTFSDIDIKCQKPDNLIECVEWHDLQSIEIVTTDEGPFYPDVFWVLTSSAASCIVPQGATNEAQLLEKLQKLPAFDNEAFIDAMSSTSNARFLCWQRQQC